MYMDKTIQNMAVSDFLPLIIHIDKFVLYTLIEGLQMKEKQENADNYS